MMGLLGLRASLTSISLDLECSTVRRRTAWISVFKVSRYLSKVCYHNEHVGLWRILSEKALWRNGRPAVRS